MKLTFLGTSHGIPGPARHCSCAMLTFGEAVYLIDGGAPAADLLIQRGISFEQIRGIFTTHMHGDHTFGLLPLINMSSWCDWYKNASYDVYLARQEGIDAFKQVLLAAGKGLDEKRIRLKLTQPGTFFEDENLRVTAVPTRHMNNGEIPTYSLIIDTKEGKRIVFTGDLHPNDAADFPQIAKQEPSDVIVCEMAHFGYRTIFPIVAQCPTKRVLFNHVWYRYEENLKAIADAQASGSMPFDLFAVNDGDEFEL